MEAAGKPSRGKKLAVAFGATLVLLFLVEGCSSAVIAWRDSGGDAGVSEQAHCVHDAELGWVNERDVHEPDLFGPHRSLSINAQGFRGLSETTRERAAGKFRIVCVGDSFTLGHGVDDQGTYPRWLERLHARVDAVNMGQGGYGVDQAYLWYLRDGAPLEADLVVFAFIAPDFDRMLDDRFQGQYPKPRLELEGGELVTTNVPVPDDWSSVRAASATSFAEGLATFDLMNRLRRRGGGERRHAVRPGQFQWTAEARAMLASLAATTRADGKQLVLMLFPLREPDDGRAPEVAEWVDAVAHELDVPFFDLRDEFKRLPKSEHGLMYLPDGHLNELGNRMVAKSLLERLALEGIGPGR